MSNPSNGPAPQQSASGAARRIAVVAIHGVGDHNPFDMANSVVNLLEDLEDVDNGNRRPRYTTFAEAKFRLNVAPVKPPGRVFKPTPDPDLGKKWIDEKGTWGPMDSLYEDESILPHNAGDGGPYSLDHLFMEGQLARYKGEKPEDTYEFLRLEGKRKAAAKPGAGGAEDSGTGIPEKDVHVYDMYWADLSKLSNAFTQIFGELYQLLFHLGSVGVNNVKAAAMFAGRSPKWKAFTACETGAASMLAWPIPFFNLIMAMFIPGFLVAVQLAKLSGPKEFMITAIALLGVVLAGFGYLLTRSAQVHWALFRAPVLVLIAATVVVCRWAALNRSTLNDPGFRETVETSAWALVTLVSLGGVWLMIAAYDKRRLGSKRAFRITLALLIAGVACAWFRDRFPERATQYFAATLSVKCIEIALLLALVSWLLFSLFSLAAYVCGRAAVATVARDQNGNRARAERTHRTAWLVLGLSSTIFLLVTLSGWTGLYFAVTPLLPHPGPSDKPEVPVRCLAGSSRGQDLCYESVLKPGSKSKPVEKWAADALHDTGMAYFPVFLVLVTIALLIGVWGLAPVVWDDISPPRGEKTEELKREAGLLGSWLDNGFGFMIVSGAILYVVTVVGYSVSILLLLLRGPLAEGTWDFGQPVARALGALLTVAGGGLLAFRGRLQSISGGFRTVVRVAMDADNWLREHPRESNPTARICGRYVSLLRHIAQWKGDDGNGYQALIVFAHSQGTVITADLLRFLQVEAKAAGSMRSYDDTLGCLGDPNELPIYLLSMGCPLRQLYALRFPYLYGYARTDAQGSNDPDPAFLGVAQWINGYRSGDYVGRYLWRPEKDANVWAPVGPIVHDSWDPPGNIPANSYSPAKDRVEFCVGPGAHQHYWDHTAKPIAEMLDTLIARVTRGPAQPVQVTPAAPIAPRASK